MTGLRLLALPAMSDRPEGPEVDATPSPYPSENPIHGRTITLEPIEEKHYAPLYEAVGRPAHAALWTYIPLGPFPTFEAFSEWVASMRHAANVRTYVIVSNATGDVLGSIFLITITPEHRTLEIGYVLFSHKMQKTTAGTEAVYLLLKTSIEDNHYRRVEWKCNHLNAASQKAARRYGFQFEGLFRQHYIVRGRNRDTAWFSLLDTEWPARKAAFEAWLDPSNFDAEGRQKRPLTTALAAPDVV